MHKEDKRMLKSTLAVSVRILLI